METIPDEMKETMDKLAHHFRIFSLNHKKMKFKSVVKEEYDPNNEKENSKKQTIFRKPTNHIDKSNDEQSIINL